MGQKKFYVPPRLTAYDPAGFPELVKLFQGDLIRAHVPATYTTIVDQDRKFIEVSDSFSKLLGYKREELIGIQYDHLTVPNTTDIPTTQSLVVRLRLCRPSVDVPYDPFSGPRIAVRVPGPYVVFSKTGR